MTLSKPKWLRNAHRMLGSESSSVYFARIITCGKFDLTLQLEAHVVVLILSKSLQATARTTDGMIASIFGTALRFTENSTSLRAQHWRWLGQLQPRWPKAFALSRRK